RDRARSLDVAQGTQFIDLRLIARFQNALDECARGRIALRLRREPERRATAAGNGRPLRRGLDRVDSRQYGLDGILFEILRFEAVERAALPAVRVGGAIHADVVI